MNKSEYWDLLVAKNPAFKKEIVTITTKSLKNIVYQAWSKGLESSTSDLFNGLFGGK